MHAYLEFERPIAELEGKIVELQKLAEADPKMDIDGEVSKLQSRAGQLVRETYAKLTPWQKVLVARHPARPHFLDYARILDEFTPLAGDRAFGEDAAVIAGLARFNGRAIAFIGQEKGNDTASRVKHNFGAAMPEGFRKAARLFELADRFGLPPVLSFADTSGAYPGVSAEERGQAEAIARSIEAGLSLHTPFIATIIGEGMSGGAVAISTANRVYMLEHSIYSVISPEGCASILWRSADKAQDAASALRITAQDLAHLKVIDAIIPEPVGGAHRAPLDAINAVADQITRGLAELDGLSRDELLKQRREKFLQMGRNV